MCDNSNGRKQGWVLVLLAVALTALSSCTTAGSSSTSKQDARAAVSKPRSTDDLKLSPERERRAEALAYYSEGIRAEMRNQPERALENYRKVVALDPEMVGVHIQIIELLVRTAKLTEALAQAEIALKHNPKNFDLLVRAGDLYQASKNSEKAIACYNEAIKLSPVGLIAYQHLAGLYLDQKNYDDAVKTLDRAAQQDYKDAVYWVRLGDSYVAVMQQGRDAGQDLKLPPKVLAAYEKALQISPKDVQLMFRAAEASVMNGDFKRAIEHYVAILDQRPDALDIRAKLALVYRETKQGEKAISEIDSLIKAQPRNWQLHRLRAELLTGLNKLDEAAASYKECLAINPDALDIYLSLSLLYMRQKKNDDAKQILGAAQEKFPKNHQVPYFFGLLYSDTKEYDKAVVGFDLAEQLASEDSNVELSSQFYFYYGAAYERKGDVDKAAEKFKKAIALDPKSPEAMNYLGYMWADKGMHLTEALDLIQKALAIDPDNGAYIDSLGWVYFKQGKFKEALAELQKAEGKLKEPDAVVFEHLGDVLDKLGRRQEAVGYWKKASELDPKNEKLLEKLRNSTNPAGQTDQPK